jgi:hypothetical protein
MLPKIGMRSHLFKVKGIGMRSHLLNVAEKSIPAFALYFNKAGL